MATRIGSGKAPQVDTEQYAVPWQGISRRVENVALALGNVLPDKMRKTVSNGIDGRRMSRSLDKLDKTLVAQDSAAIAHFLNKTTTTVANQTFANIVKRDTSDQAKEVRRAVMKSIPFDGASVLDWSNDAFKFEALSLTVEVGASPKNCARIEHYAKAGANINAVNSDTKLTITDQTYRKKDWAMFEFLCKLESFDLTKMGDPKARDAVRADQVVDLAEKSHAGDLIRYLEPGGKGGVPIEHHADSDDKIQAGPSSRAELTEPQKEQMEKVVSKAMTKALNSADFHAFQTLLLAGVDPNMRVSTSWSDDETPVDYIAGEIERTFQAHADDLRKLGRSSDSSTKMRAKNEERLGELRNMALALPDEPRLKVLVQEIRRYQATEGRSWIGG